MKAKERTAIERVKMPELDPLYRATTRTEEVNIGLTKEMALTEAKRCLDCPKPTCMEGCPVSINIPSFIKNIERGQFLAAAKVLKNPSALPAVCGRVCPQEKQCESKCVHLKMNEPAVAIGYLERFAADYERQSGNISVPKCDVVIVDEEGNVLPADDPHRFFEASWMHKYKGKYYFSYSTGDTHYLCYAVGDNPYGPFTYKGVILEPVVGWTTHHSICEYKGQWYLFHHDCVPSNDTTWLRSVKVAPLFYDECLKSRMNLMRRK